MKKLYRVALTIALVGGSAGIYFAVTEQLHESLMAWFGTAIVLSLTNFIPKG